MIVPHFSSLSTTFLEEQCGQRHFRNNALTVVETVVEVSVLEVIGSQKIENGSITLNHSRINKT